MKKLYLDIDNCITNSTKAFCHCYNLFYNFKHNFIPTNYQKVDKWNFTDQATLIKSDEDVERIFNMQTFFANLEFINPNTKEILQELNEKFHIVLCSIGTYSNISLKSDWVHKNLPFIKDSLFIVNGGSIMDKSIINMECDSFFIDDVSDNLDSVKSIMNSHKICFGKIASWNKEWQGIRCSTWDDVKEYLGSME